MKDGRYNFLNGRVVKALIKEDGDITIEFTDDTYAEIISLGESDRGVLELECALYDIK